MFTLICGVIALIAGIVIIVKNENGALTIPTLFVSFGIGILLGAFGDFAISRYAEIETKTEIAEHELIPIEEKSGLYRYLVKNEEQKVWKEINVSNSIAVYAEEGRKKPILREIKETTDYKDSIAKFLFNAKKARKNTAMIIFPRN